MGKCVGHSMKLRKVKTLQNIIANILLITIQPFSMVLVVCDDDNDVA